MSNEPWLRDKLVLSLDEGTDTQEELWGGQADAMAALRKYAEDLDAVRELVYSMPYGEWKKKYMAGPKVAHGDMKVWN